MRIYEDKVLESLRDLSDLEYQARVWTGNSLPEMSSFVECIETLFDDSGLGAALDGDGAFGEPVDGQLRALSDHIDRIEADEPYAVLAADPNFDQATRLAAEILKVLSDRGADDSTR